MAEGPGRPSAEDFISLTESAATQLSQLNDGHVTTPQEPVVNLAALAREPSILPRSTGSRLFEISPDSTLAEAVRLLGMLSGGVFVLGSFALRYYPRRPGVLRRQALLGAACGNYWASAYYGARLEAVIDAAFDVEDGDTREKQVWRRIVAAPYAPLQKIHTDVLLAVQSTTPSLQEFQGMRRDMLLRTLDWHDMTYCLFTKPATSTVWMLIIDAVSGRSEDSVKYTDNVHDVLRLPAYMSLLSHGFPTRVDVAAYGSAGMFVSAAMGMLLRRTFLLRASLALGLSSLGAQAWTTALQHRMLDGPSKFVNQRQAEQWFLDFFQDPLDSNKDVNVKELKAAIKHRYVFG